MPLGRVRSILCLSSYEGQLQKSGPPAEWRLARRACCHDF
ncbi:hypothetical protein AcetOrient_orf02256 [Acetobacter orientalis]|uniref:Uncharacterized protein n=1 Tax=Acetobacter orientalis TaxID=146474 RepID=A0A2Z5ZHE1_9PROT|nr:hypothetical protein AcetOrient_orf02256 [Acetobacter orientalis]